jgi:hypothetical protein
MNAYEKARDLIQRVETHRVEISNHQTMIAQLEVELQSALKEADLTTNDRQGPAPVKAVTSAVSTVKRSHRKKVATPKAVPLRPKRAVTRTKAVLAPPKRAAAQSKAVLAPPKRATAQAKAVLAPPKRAVAPSKPAAKAPAKKQPSKTSPSRNGSKGHDPNEKPTLGDLVRTVIIKAGRPLKRLEIQAGLQELNYSNSTRNPYRTLGVRLHRLDSRGVVSVGNSQFDVTPVWKRKHARLIVAAEKKAAKQAALPPAAAAPVTAGEPVATPEPVASAAT